jgi:lactoylglutathione lyase
MLYQHTMIRVTDLDQSLRFYCEGLGFKVIKKNEYPDGKFTLVFLQSAEDSANHSPGEGPMIELTYNWGVSQYTRGDAFGHIAFRVSSIADIQTRLKQNGYDLSWGPGKAPNGRRSIAFIDDPDGYEIELIEE